MLVLLYYLSQNPDFTESAKPLMEKLKDSQQMLSFLNDLSHFTQTFSTIKPSSETKKDSCNDQQPSQKKETSNQNDHNNENDHNDHSDEQKENPPFPGSGIADEFIQNILDSYLKKH